MKLLLNYYLNLMIPESSVYFNFLQVTEIGVSRLAANNPNLKHWQLNFHNDHITNFVIQLQGVDSQDSISVSIPEEELQESEETDREDDD